nr:MAG TPA: hypothetical protein [Bacteriophage sp.]
MLKISTRKPLTTLCYLWYDNFNNKILLVALGGLKCLK